MGRDETTADKSNFKHRVYGCLNMFEREADMKRLLILLALSALWPLSSGWAAVAGAEKAAELLAKAWMIDARCNVLDRDDRDALTGFVARAELSLAEKDSVSVARSAIARGRAAGTTAACDEQNAAAVRLVLRAARSATSVQDAFSSPMAAGKPAYPTPVPQGVAPMVSANPQLAVKPPRTPEAVSLVKPAKKVTGLKLQKPLHKRGASGVAGTVGVSGYAATAEKYYHELRCRTMSARAVNALYAKVLREHRQAVSTSGKSAVRRLLRNAKMRALEKTC
jgi:hypothetical protein